MTEIIRPKTKDLVVALIKARWTGKMPIVIENWVLNDPPGGHSISGTRRYRELRKKYGFRDDYRENRYYIYVHKRILKKMFKENGV